jgi:hypothetical protein
MTQSRDTTKPTVAEILMSLRRRQRMLNIVRHAAHGLFAGAVIALGLVGAAWLMGGGSPWAERLPWLIAGAISGGAVVGAVVGILSRVSDLAVARALDRAASSEDRFASAVQLAAHHRQQRANLVADDALARVGDTAAAAALPLRAGVPRSAKWTAMPILGLVALLLFLPDRALVAAAPTPPEITDEQWAQLHEEFERELENLPKPETQQEQEMREMLEDLARLLEQKPDKKDALKEIARLSEQVQKQRQALDTRDINMKDAAKAMARSEALKQFAAMLRQGDYDNAASELQNLAQQMEENTLSPSATEFESIAQDMERLANELASHPEMQQACEKCSGAASSMNKQSLSEAMKRLSEQLKKNSKSMKQCDNCNRSSSLLDMLKRSMNQCKGGNCNKPGLCQKPGDKPGGLKAGWGSAAQWNGGALAKTDETRDPDIADTQERNGENSSYTVVSPDERAESGLSYDEIYADFVQKTEADLDLESVPLACRDFLRRYFNSIRPEEAPADDADASPN